MFFSFIIVSLYSCRVQLLNDYDKGLFPVQKKLSIATIATIASIACLSPTNPKSPLLFQVVVEIAGDALVKVHALVAAHIVWFAGIHVEVGLRAGGDACL